MQRKTGTSRRYEKGLKKETGTFSSRPNRPSVDLFPNTGFVPVLERFGKLWKLKAPFSRT